MAYYDSGQQPSVICPICGARHQNANLMQGFVQTISASNTNINFAQDTARMISGMPPTDIAYAPADMVDELKYPDLAWLNREVSRYTKL